MAEDTTSRTEYTFANPNTQKIYNDFVNTPHSEGNIGNNEQEVKGRIMAASMKASALKQTGEEQTEILKFMEGGVKHLRIKYPDQEQLIKELVLNSKTLSPVAPRLGWEEKSK